jgi:hypothetical protein
MPPELPGYDRVRLLRKKGQNETWLVRGAGKEIVLKYVHVATADELLDVAARASSAVQMRHLRFAHLLDRGKSGDHVFTAREHVPRGSLADHAAGLSVATKLRIAGEVGSALDHLHRHGLAHGAVHARNVLLLPGDEARLADIALGPAVPDELTAPERRATGVLDRRTDQYALAALTGWMLTGRVPTSRDQITPVEELDVALRRALDDVPARRFPHIDALTEAIVAGSRASGTMPAALDTKVEPVGHMVRVRLAGRFIEAGLRRCVEQIENVLREPGPWSIAYSLEASGGCQSIAIDSLVALHRRHRTRLRRVGFLTERPEARGFGVLVGTGVDGLPWKVFGAEDSMRAWLAEGTA